MNIENVFFFFFSEIRIYLLKYWFPEGEMCLIVMKTRIEWINKWINDY